MAILCIINDDQTVRVSETKQRDALLALHYNGKLCDNFMIMKLILASIFVCELTINSPQNISFLNSLALFLLLWTLVEYGRELRFIILTIIVMKTVILAAELAQTSVPNVLHSWDFYSYCLWFITLKLVQPIRADGLSFDAKDTYGSQQNRNFAKKVIAEDMENISTPSELCMNPQMKEDIKILIKNGYSLFYYEGKPYRFDVHKPTGVIAHIHDEEALNKTIRTHVINL